MVEGSVILNAFQDPSSDIIHPAGGAASLKRAETVRRVPGCTPVTDSSSHPPRPSREGIEGWVLRHPDLPSFVIPAKAGIPLPTGPPLRRPFSFGPSLAKVRGLEWECA